MAGSPKSSDAGTSTETSTLVVFPHAVIEEGDGKARPRLAEKQGSIPQHLLENQGSPGPGRKQRGIHLLENRAVIEKLVYPVSNGHAEHCQKQGHGHSGNPPRRQTGSSG